MSPGLTNVSSGVSGSTGPLTAGPRLTYWSLSRQRGDARREDPMAWRLPSKAMTDYRRCSRFRDERRLHSASDTRESSTRVLSLAVFVLGCTSRWRLCR